MSDEIDREYFELCEGAPYAKIVTCDNCPACAREYYSGDLNHRSDCPYRPLDEMRNDQEGLA